LARNSDSREDATEEISYNGRRRWHTKPEQLKRPTWLKGLSLSEQNSLSEIKGIAVAYDELPPIQGSDKRIAETPQRQSASVYSINLGAQHARENCEDMFRMSRVTVVISSRKSSY
jgi:hypothetical protein